MKPISQDTVPATIDEAVQILFDSLDDSDRNYILNSNPTAVHMTMGRYLRNTWSLWEDTPMRRDFQQRFRLFGHGDDMSGMILKSLWAKVCRAPAMSAIQEAEADFYRRHWQQAGLDPLTGKPTS